MGTKKKHRVRQYVIVSQGNVIIRPFASMEEAEKWAWSYAGFTEGASQHISEMYHLDISSRFNLKY